MFLSVHCALSYLLPTVYCPAHRNFLRRPTPFQTAQFRPILAHSASTVIACEKVQLALIGSRPFQFVFIVLLGLVLMGRHKCEVVACLSSQVKYDLYELLYCLLYLWRINLIWFDLIYGIVRQLNCFHVQAISLNISESKQVHNVD